MQRSVQRAVRLCARRTRAANLLSATDLLLLAPFLCSDPNQKNCQTNLYRLSYPASAKPPCLSSLCHRTQISECHLLLSAMSNLAGRKEPTQPKTPLRVRSLPSPSVLSPSQPYLDRSVVCLLLLPAIRPAIRWPKRSALSKDLQPSSASRHRHGRDEYATTS